MEIYATTTVMALLGDGARRALAPTPVRARGGAVSNDGFPRALDSALTGILVV